jgi:hypothetical protein
MRGLQLVDRWNPQPGEPFAGIPKCFEGAGQNEVGCAGLRWQGGAVFAPLQLLPPPGSPYEDVDDWPSAPVPGGPRLNDGPLDPRLAAHRKINSYRQQYTDNQNISFSLPS